MAETFVGHASVTINTSRAHVWDALVNPEKIKQYMPVTSVVSDWRENSPIVWRSEFQDKPFEVRGTILIRSRTRARVRPLTPGLPRVRTWAFVIELSARDDRTPRRGSANARFSHRAGQQDQTRPRALGGKLADGAERHEGIVGRRAGLVDPAAVLLDVVQHEGLRLLVQVPL